MTSYRLNKNKFVTTSSIAKDQAENESVAKNENGSNECPQEPTLEKNRPVIGLMKIQLHSKTSDDSQSKFVKVSFFGCIFALVVFSAIVVNYEYIKNSHGTDNIIYL